MWIVGCELYLMISFCVILLYRAVYKRLSWQLMALVVVVSSVLAMISYGDSRVSLITWNWYSDSVMKTFKVILYLIAGMTLVTNVRQLDNKVEYGWLVLVSVWSLGILLNSTNLLTFYIVIEIQSLAFYVLVSYKRLSAYSIESGLKYFIIGAVNSGILLLGISVLYSEYGTVNYDSLSILMKYKVSIGSDIGVVLIMVSLYLKASLAPFNMWYVDVIDGALTRSSMILSLVPKIAVLPMIIKMLLILGDNAVVKYTMVIVGVLSIFISMIAAYYQRKVKRFLAYSSIANMAYMILALPVLENNELLIQSVTRYMLVYAITGLAVWTLVERSKIVYISELNKQRSGSLMVVYLILILSMASVPPMVGFTVKVDLLLSMISSGYGVIAGLILVCTIGITYNYLRWLKILYNDNDVKEVKEVRWLDNKDGLVITVPILVIVLAIWLV